MSDRQGRHDIRVPAKREPEERFWEKVEKHDLDCPCCVGCWWWTGTKTSRGYGSFGAGPKRHDGRGSPGMVRAHRWAYDHFVGPIPKGLHVLHRCDNPACVNYEAHLFVGTRSDNMRDAVAKGRQPGPPKGDLHHSAKLTASTVAEIRRTFTGARGEIKGLAERYGVRRTVMADAIYGRTWKNA